MPFYTLAHEIAPGRFRPTMTHAFIRLLSDKGLLHTHFTQNIDTLERRAGVPESKIIEAHGSFATSRCIDCQKPFPQDEMKAKIAEKSIPHCASCGGLAKPEIVFFGEALPENFFKSIYALREADLLFIMGTSLTVYPFASLCEIVPSDCPRVLVNWDEVGDIGERENDVLLLGDCDEIVSKICDALQWGQVLNELWEEGKDSIEGLKVDLSDNTASPPAPTEAEETVENLAEQIDTALKLTDEENKGRGPSASDDGLKGDKDAKVEPELLSTSAINDRSTPKKQRRRNSQ